MSDISSPGGDFQVEPKVKGRPPVPIDEQLVEHFLSIGLPIQRISDYFNVTDKTLWNRFGNKIHQHRVRYEATILQKQLELAEAGDGKMLIHLGKTALTYRQTEQAPLTVEEAEKAGVEFTVVHPQPPAALEDE